MRTFEYNSISHDDTIALGRCIGEQLKGGEVIALVGPLGSGKTHIIKGIAAGAGASDASVVTSPTFVLVNEYEGRNLHIYHIDAYRLESVREFEMLGFDDLCQPDSVVVIEWADKVLSIVQNTEHMRVTLAYAGQTARRILLQNVPEYITITPH